jgi:SynChlorMet cassette protein ScmC
MHRWLDKLATIMVLEECEWNGSSKLTFSMAGDTGIAGDGKHTKVPSLVSGAGWVMYDHDIIRIWCHRSIPDVICEINSDGFDTVGYVNMKFSLHPIYQRSVLRGGLPFHSGLVELEDRGVLLVGPGNSGKSTCCARLPSYWNRLSDDETLVTLHQQREYRAHPFPTWSDYLWEPATRTWKVQYSVRLSGVFFLEQSEIDEAVPLGAGEAAILMSESAVQVFERFWERIGREVQRESRIELFTNACAMAKAIPAFRLRVSLHGRFWEQIEKALGW